MIILQTVGLLGRVISSSQGLYLNTGQHNHRISTYTYQTSMPCVGFEHTIPASEQAKTVLALDRSGTVTGISVIYSIFQCYPLMYIYVSQFISCPETFKSKCCMRFYFPPCRDGIRSKLRNSTKFSFIYKTDNAERKLLSVYHSGQIYQNKLISAPLDHFSILVPHHSSSLMSMLPVTVAQRSEACTVFAHSEAGIMGSNPTQGTDVGCVCAFFCVCPVFR
jgi:hypothetical protein